MKAKTFDDDKFVEVSVPSQSISSTGLLKVITEDGRILVRHKNRLEPLDTETKQFLTGE